MKYFKNVTKITDVCGNLKIIDIIVEEKPTGEISAGAGVGTNGGSFAINISENNWLGRGNSLDFQMKLIKSLFEEILIIQILIMILKLVSYFISNEENDK